MSRKKQLQQCWKLVGKMVRNKNSLDIGFLHRICDILLSQQLLTQDFTSDHTKQQPITSIHMDFVMSVNQFLSLPADKLLRKPSLSQQLSNNSSSEYLLLIIVDSILFNLYARSKNMDKLRLNNSFFNTSVSMSMSQMSDQWSQHNYSVINTGNEAQMLKLTLGYVEALATSDAFMKKLKVFYERVHNKAKNHHYLENLLETLQYILSKEKLNQGKESFLKHKNNNFKSFLNPTSAVTFSPTSESLQEINSIIFSNQLNKIVSLLSNCDEELFYSLNRIYFVAKKSEERKHFRAIKYSSGEMFYNLCKVYVQSFRTKMQVLQQSKNPLFLLIKSHLTCFFMPVFKSFSQIILSMPRQQSGNMLGFYKGNEQVLQRELLRFIEELPLQLIELLNLLYRLIERHYGTTPSTPSSQSGIASSSIHEPSQSSGSCLAPVKRFFIYSFLVEPQLIKQYIFSNVSLGSNESNKRVQIEEFEQVCNYIINLFFTSSVKKYTSNYNSQQLSPLISLSRNIQAKFEEKIINYDQQQQEFYYDDQSLIENYFIEEPILNHDYQVIQKALHSIEFTPKDLKQFQLKKDIYERTNIRNQEIFYNNQHINIKQEDDLLYNKDPKNKHMKKETDHHQDINNNQIMRGLRRQLTLSPTRIKLIQEKEQYLIKNTNTFFPSSNHHSTTMGFYPSSAINQTQTDNQDEVDFLTWMTVGGSHNYKEKVSAKKIKLYKTQQLNRLPQGNDHFWEKKSQNIKSDLPKQKIEPENDSKQFQEEIRHGKKRKLREFRTFNKDKVRQIKNLYEQYASGITFY